MTVNSTLTIAVKLAADMLTKIEKTGVWEDDADKKMETLGNMITVLTKLLPLDEKGAAKKSISRKHDERILRDYVARKKMPIKTGVKKK